MIASTIHKVLVAAGVPIDGVSIGTSDDKSTWEIRFKADATDAQKATALAALAAFDPVAEAAKPKPLTIEQRLAALETDVTDLKRGKP